MSLNSDQTNQGRTGWRLCRPPVIFSKKQKNWNIKFFPETNFSKSKLYVSNQPVWHKQNMTKLESSLPDYFYP